MIHFLFPMCRCLNAMVEQSHPSHLHSQLFSSSDKNLVIGPPLLLLMYSSLKCFWGCPSSANNPPISFPLQLPLDLSASIRVPKGKMSSFASPSLSLLLFLLLPVLGLAQLLLPSTHSPLPLAGATRKPCACPPGKTPQALPAERPKAHHPAGGGPSEGNAKEGMDDELLDALKEVGQVGQRLAPLKAGKKGNKGKGKKRKGAGRTRRPRPKRAIDGQQQQQSVIDPALAAPEGAKCNSERLRELIKKVGTVGWHWHSKIIP